ncbi:hypothetical protein Salat_1119400 [Sesamum alatum]|uniref:Uncharacterized protein n=1 Tax=Sesamum alatum TaxID=300844 RepID=A0AAE1YNN1_9LAMI|nr:hypothetical protein Salat_1119400 [Sesamum alatum]
MAAVLAWRPTVFGHLERWKRPLWCISGEGAVFAQSPPALVVPPPLKPTSEHVLTPFPPTGSRQARRTIIPLHPQPTTIDIPPPPTRDPPCLNDVSASAAAATARVSSDSRFPAPAPTVSVCNFSSSTTAATSRDLSYSRVFTPPTASCSPPH